VREIILATILTQQRSKEDILTMYLNEIYYGNLAYGIEAAAQTYFGKGAGALNLAEAAFLAGLPQSPIGLDPYTNFAGAKARQEFILDLMVTDGVITELDNVVAKAIVLELVPLIGPTAEVKTLLAPHFILYVQNQLTQQYGAEALLNGGWQVITSLDLPMQLAAEQIIREQVAAQREAHNLTNGAGVVLKPSTGEVLAMVGSIDYFDTVIGGQINMALAPRQPGSAFKPITYAAGMEKGWNTAVALWDVPIELEVGMDSTMIPVNYNGRYHGPMLLREALANSYNIPPLQVARDVGLPYIIQTARKMGITSLSEQPGFYGLSLTLGSGEMPLLELTHAYATLANQGAYQKLQTVLEIRDSEGRLMVDNNRNRLPPNRILDPGIAYILTDILDDDRARETQMGRNNALELPFPAAVKTGTTNEFRDNLVVGYTPAVVVGMWYGNNDYSPMIDSSGLRGAAPAWNKLLQTIYGDEGMLQTLLVNGELIVEFPRPSTVVEKEVCLPRGTGGSSCTARATELFLVNAPQQGLARLGYRPDGQTNPGAWTLTVLPLPAEEAAKVIQQPLPNGFAPPPPRFCVVNQSGTATQNMAGAQTRLFLPIPPFYPDEVRARLWGERQGWNQMAPPVACPLNVVRAAQTGGRATAVATPPPPPPPADNPNP
jgi:membrane peptidoglycan carboxypeptidase